MSDITNFQLTFRFDHNNSRTEIWPVDQLPPDEALTCKPVDKSFVESISIHGVFTPIWLAILTDHNQDVFVVAGSRRIKAARLAGITEIKAEVREMTLLDAMAARSMENNKRSDNVLADLQGLEYLLAYEPGLINHPRVLADSLGMKIGTLKKLLPQVQVSRLFRDALKEGHISEETMRKLSTIPSTYLKLAAERFADNKAKMLADQANGKIFKKAPILLSDADLLEFQQVRKTEAANSLPNLPQQGSIFDDSVLAQLGIATEPIEGYLVLYEQDGVQTIHNYQMYSKEDAASIQNELAANYPNLGDLHLAKVVRVD